MTESLSDVWVDACSFEDRWDIQGERVGQGGQGIGHRAVRRSDQKVAFIKLMDSDNGERRSRSYIEARAYETLTDLDVPKLIESNAHRHDDKSVRLYIATEFIEGLTLRKWRDGVKKVSLSDAIDITLHLLGTVAGAHKAGIVHRDIKPENIIMREADVVRPVLVDFGIAFNRLHILRRALTSDGSQLGNRFLWLPELSGSSRNKRSPTADLAMVSGIFLYLLTGINPVLPRDGEGNLPHQRERIRSKINEVEKDSVLSFFDRAFQFEPAARFQTADEVSSALQKIRHRIYNPDVVDDLSELQNILENPLFQVRGQVSTRLGEALGWAMSCYGVVRTKTNGNVLAQQVDISNGASPGHIRIRWDVNGTYRVCTHIWVEIIGSEFVWHTVRGEVFRAPTNVVLGEAAKEEFINRSVMPDILRVIKTDPIKLPEEFAGRFSLRDRLAYSLDEAIQKSQSYGVPIFVIAYHEMRTEDDRRHLLQCVLGDSYSQEVILSSFVVLIIKRSQLPMSVEAVENTDFRAVLHEGQWTHIRHLAANREAAKMEFAALQKEFSSQPG